MKLVKHFDFQNDTKLNESDWNVAVGDKWANAELQHYVHAPKNLFFENGLVIQATNCNGIYESTRLNTKGKFSMRYGRIEVVCKVPKGVGTWPAIWMMPQENKYGYWPKSGEIDILEHVGRELDEVFFCLHTEDYNHTKGNDYYKKILHKGFSDDFQKITFDWTREYIRYYLNDIEVVTYHKGGNGMNSSPSGWPFDEEFYLILNMAIGGKFGGPVDDSVFPQKFVIKDIKIYQ